MNQKLYKLSGKAIWVLALLLCSFSSFAQPCQTITVQMVSTSPAGMGGDGNPIRICQNATVSFVATATFSSSSTGALYIWTYGDDSGPDTTNTLVTSHMYPDGGVYIVDLLVVDPQGCQNGNRLQQVVQVSTTPIFAGTNSSADTICMNSTAVLHGEAVATPGIYECAPPVADTTFLPDGTNVSYQTSIEVECFAFGTTLTNVNQLQSICLNMEHSFLGDLGITITCPNAQTVTLKEFPGGGGTYLGGAIDDNLLTVGVGADYCFSNTAAWGTMVAENGLGNWVQTGVPVANSMSPGTYTSFQSFTGLIGCPLNGNWTITVTDYQAVDNGYIFNWGVNFDPTLLPGSYSFLPTFTSQGWNANPDIIATTNGGHNITVRPNSGGQKCYTYKVTDNFGCSYDTTVCLYVVDPGNPGLDTTFKWCQNQGTFNAFDYLAGNPDAGGTWSGTGVTPGGVFNPGVAGGGLHDITYTLHSWNCDTTATITVNVVNEVDMDFTFEIMQGCTADTVQFTNLSEPGTYWWNFADGTLPEDTATNPLHIYQDQNIYNVRLMVRNLDGCVDSVTKPVDVRHPLIAAFNVSVDSVCQTEGTPVQFTDASIGAITGWRWDFNDGATSTQQNPTHVFSQAGTHTVTLVINDVLPCYDTVTHNIFVDSIPFLGINTDRHVICAGEQVNFTATYLHPALSLNWDFGDGIHWDQADATSHKYEQPGTYFITVLADYPVCADATVSDSVVVNGFPVVYLGPDSVLCLDGPAITVGDQNNTSDPSVTWLWNTGATTPAIEIVHPGTYSVTATKNDCATTENIVVNKDCYTDIPNAFTPNGDGQNDYFYPRQLLTQGVKSFTMVIYNRWGQKLFETSNPNGRGWDGKFNEKDQPVGVYIYQIKAVMKNGRAEDYTGNVTLVR